jgi:hypothetical protein
MDALEPKRPISTTDTEDPSLAKERKLTLEPRWQQSKTLTAEPNLAMLVIEIELPNRAKILTDKLLPK